MRKILLTAALALVISACSGDGVTTTTRANTATTSVVTTTSTTTSTTSPPTTTTTTTTTTIPVPVGVPEEPSPPTAAPEPDIITGFTGHGVVTIAAGGAELYEEIGGEPMVTAREGLVFAAEGMQGDWIEVFTSCDSTAWVNSSQVLAQPPSPTYDIGNGFDFAKATIVIDPGHGGPWNTGAASPSGLAEEAVNLDIARRVVDLLDDSHTVDWDTGEIFTGDQVPAAGWVLTTRAGDAETGDYEAGLTFRSELANAANATAMVAIHNNAGWEVNLDMPGSDVYYQSQIPSSRRFAKIMVQELRRSFAPFVADWVGARFTGAKSRLSPRDGNPQYYGILRRSEMPTVITEGAYISNPSEAALLATPEFRQAYADAIYRGLIRFLTTDDTGTAGASDPEIWNGDAGSGDARPQCQIPEQPAG
jgi:N-acetylmuramoyl-L-alanine amidase